MIIVYVDTQEDTSTFKTLYDGIECTLLTNPRRSEVVKILEDNPTETLMCFGHGSSNGLFSSHIDENMVIDGQMIHLLKDREIIGIWCYASQFAIKHNLKGFFTYMFISNSVEAKCFMYKGGNEEIFAENKLFAERINNFIKDKTPLCEWVDKLNEVANHDIDFVHFNYSNLSYLDGDEEYVFSDSTIFDDNLYEDYDDYSDYLIHFASISAIDDALTKKFGEDYELSSMTELTDEEFIKISDFHFKTLEDYANDFNYNEWKCPDCVEYMMRIIKK